MSRRFNSPVSPRIADPEVDRQVRNINERIAELLKCPLLRGKPLTARLVDGVETPVPHGLGHRATLYMAIPLQQASGAATGRLMDITPLRSSTVDVKNTSVLLATGFTVTLVVEVWAV